MQTFLPFPDFDQSAKALDSRRLNKQSVECYQIGLILWRKRGWLPNPTNKKGFWNHPAVKMWQGYEVTFMTYWSSIIHECAARKIECTKLRERWWELEEVLPWNLPYEDPKWLGNPDLHASHQSNLKRKDPLKYPFPLLPDNLPYIWPSAKENESL